MRWEQFKNRLSKEAKEEQVDVDVDAIWRVIEPQVDILNAQKPRKRRFLLLFFFGGLLVLGSGWLGYQLLTTSADSSPLIAIEELEDKNVREQPKAERNDAGVPVEEVLQLAEEAILSPQETAAVVEVPQEVQQDMVIKNPSTTANPAQSQAKDTNPRQTNIYPQTPQQTPKPQTLSSRIKSTASTSQNNIISPTTTTTSPPAKAPVNPIPSAKATRLESLPHLPWSLATNFTFPQLKIAPLPFPEQEEPKDSPRQSSPALQFSVEASGGLSYIRRSLNAKSATANELLQIRQDYESPLEALHYGLAFGLQHQSGFRLSLGLQQTTMTERYQFDETHIVIDSVMGIQVYRVHPRGDTIPIMGMVPRSTTTIYNKDIYNTYRLLDIPILLSYQYPLGKWQLGLEAGALVNLSLKTEGIIADENFEDVDIEGRQSELFKSKLGLNYQFGLSVSRRLFDRFDLRLAPTLRYFPTDFSVASYELSQEYLLLGGNLGLRYNF